MEGKASKASKASALRLRSSSATVSLAFPPTYLRLVEVAKKLGMTGQELRRELTQVDFGVKPTDREVPDTLAHGIIRYVARKYNIEVKEDAVSDAPIEKPSETSQQPTPTVERAKEEESSEGEKGEKGSDEGVAKKVHVLRKLSLEGAAVPTGAVAIGVPIKPPPAKRTLSKAQQEEQRQERKMEKLYEKKRILESQEQIKAKRGVVELPEAISVKEFAEKTGVQVPKVISTLMKNGVLATINQHIDFETASIVATELGVEVKKVQVAASAERLIAGDLKALLQEDDPTHLLPRPPIVTVMGHVDHGKTAILDAIRKTNVAASEAGGITQRIGAYEVIHDGKSVTFLDTPGHEAFTAMRARGAQITDVVVLVVAADEGVQPTTVEAIDHAKDAGVPILVALNKVDKEGADPDRVKGDLAKHDLQPEEWGGTTPVVPCSAKTGQGIDNLVEHVLLLSELRELKANPHRLAVATVIEAHLDPSLGPVASVVVNAGTLRVPDIFVCGAAFGRVKSMMDARGGRIEVVGPSGAVRISGFSKVPEAGDILQVVEDEKKAKELLAELLQARASGKERGLGDLMSRLSEGKLTALKIVLKVDSGGSLEALRDAIAKLPIESGVAPKVIHGGVGAITEGDVMMARASDGIVLGFNVDVSAHVEKVAAKLGVEVRLYDVIYKLLEDTGALLQGMVEPEEEEKILGHLEVRGVFFEKKSEKIIGGKVLDGVVKRVPFRVFREGRQVGTGRITSLRHVEKEIREAKEGSECGMRVEVATPIIVGDQLEAYVMELKKKVPM